MRGVDTFSVLHSALSLSDLDSYKVFALKNKIWPFGLQAERWLYLRYLSVRWNTAHHLHKGSSEDRFLRAITGVLKSMVFLKAIFSATSDFGWFAVTSPPAKETKNEWRNVCKRSETPKSKGKVMHFGIHQCHQFLLGAQMRRLKQYEATSSQWAKLG